MSDAFESPGADRPPDTSGTGGERAGSDAERSSLPPADGAQRESTATDPKIEAAPDTPGSEGGDRPTDSSGAAGEHHGDDPERGGLGPDTYRVTWEPSGTGDAEPDRGETDTPAAEGDAATRDTPGSEAGDRPVDSSGAAGEHHGDDPEGGGLGPDTYRVTWEPSGTGDAKPDQGDTDSPAAERDGADRAADNAEGKAQPDSRAAELKELKQQLDTQAAENKELKKQLDTQAADIKELKAHRAAETQRAQFHGATKEWVERFGDPWEGRVSPEYKAWMERMSGDGRDDDFSDGLADAGIAGAAVIVVAAAGPGLAVGVTVAVGVALWTHFN